MPWRCRQRPGPAVGPWGRGPAAAPAPNAAPRTVAAPGRSARRPPPPARLCPARPAYGAPPPPRSAIRGPHLQARPRAAPVLHSLQRRRDAARSGAGPGGAGGNELNRSANPAAPGGHRDSAGAVPAVTRTLGGAWASRAAVLPSSKMAAAASRPTRARLPAAAQRALPGAVGGSVPRRFAFVSLSFRGGPAPLGHGGRTGAGAQLPSLCGAALVLPRVRRRRRGAAAVLHPGVRPPPVRSLWAVRRSAARPPARLYRRGFGHAWAERGVGAPRHGRGERPPRPACPGPSHRGLRSLRSDPPLPRPRLRSAGPA